ncbi:MAG: hypothetical protein IH608_07180 [Proteobacteria bacterium]|nr:hypothetical protein [Pseudomonadota bacterium]
MKTLAALLLLLWALPAWAVEFRPADYQEVTQADLVKQAEEYKEKKVQFTGSFLFTGSDFCYQIRKTKINTRDYFCFALGTPSLVRLYLKKDAEQADQLLNLKKGAKVTAFGTFDSLGADYNFLVVDAIEVEPAP